MILSPYKLFSKCVSSFVALVILATPTVTGYIGTRALWSAAFPVAAYLASIPSSAYAGPFEDAAAAGNVAGRLELPKNSAGTSNIPGGTITLQNANPAVNNTTISVGSLFQGAASPANAASAAAASSTYGDSAQMYSQSIAAQTDLLAPANNSAWSNGYKTLRGSALSRSHPDFTNDPVAVSGRAAFNGTDPNAFISGLNANCVTTTTVSPGGAVTHLEDLRRCERYVGASGCRITRNIVTENQGARPIFTFDGDIDHTIRIRVVTRMPTAASVSSAGDGATIAADAAAQGVFYEESNETGQGEQSATVTINPFTDAEIPPDAPNRIVEYKVTINATGSAGTPTIDPPTAGNGWIMTIDYLTPGLGFQHATLQVIGVFGSVLEGAPYDEPPGCSAETATCSAQPVAWTPTASVADQASTNAWQCLNADASRFFGPVEVDPTDWPKLLPLYSGEPAGSSPICYQAQARNFVCPAPTTPGDTCATLLANPACVFKSSQCPPDNIDENTGLCTYFEDTYDCGTDVPNNAPTSTTTTTCGGPVRCMGTDCATPLDKEVNPDFEKSAMALQVATYAAQDKECTLTDCAIFKGDGYVCKIAFGGVSDCCESPGGTSIADYIRLIYYTYKVADFKAIGEVLTSNGLDGVVGAWNELANFASTTYTELTQPFVSAWESVTTNVGGELGSTIGLEAMKTAVQNQLYDWMVDLGLQDLAATVFTQVGANQVLSSAATEALSMLATAFMYYQIAILVIQLVYACEAKEMELAVKKEMRLCHYLGRYCHQRFLGICVERRHSYCCFKSPFARIVQEQVRIQYAMPWPGPSSNPTCPALTVAQLAAVDWSTVDLSEWLALLKSADLMPSSMADADAQYNMDRITGFVNADGTHGKTVVDNAQRAVQAPASPGAANETARAGLWGTLP